MKKLFLLFSLLLVSAMPVYAALESGQPAPDFTLVDSNGQSHSLAEHKGQFVVLEWFNPDCPFVKKHYDNSGNIPALQKKYTSQDVVWLSINSSAAGKEGHYTPEATNAWAKQTKAASNAFLLDSDGKVGRLYGAKTTPHMFVINPEGILIYQGAIDDKSSANAADIASSVNYVQTALDEAIAGKPVSTPATKSYGCSVKY